MLYIVATPIGNLEDISMRALRILKEVDLISAEDTRHSRKLLSHFDIHTSITSFHSHSSDAKARALVNEMLAGKKIALISDAGTPGISDPAWTLIQMAIQNNITIVPVPGASAFLTALMGAGMPMNAFIYLGFPPVKKGRMTWFNNLKNYDKTIVFYESPHRIIKTITQLMEVFPHDKKIVIARELTKIHEEFHRATLQELYDYFLANTPKGEMVVLI